MNEVASRVLREGICKSIACLIVWKNICGNIQKKSGKTPINLRPAREVDEQWEFLQHTYGVCLLSSLPHPTRRALVA